MEIQLQRLSNDSHKLTVIRDDGTSDSVDLETKSYLKHDLIHFAVEESAGLQSGFWGSLAAGKSIAAINNQDVFLPGGTPSTDAAYIEMITGAFTGYALHSVSIQELMSGLQNLFHAYGLQIPDYFTRDVAERAKERFRKLMGEWNALPFQETMHIKWK